MMPFEKPDDVSLTEVEEEFANLKFEKDHPLYTVLSHIQSSLKRIDSRMGGFDTRLVEVKTAVNDTKQEIHNEIRSLKASINTQKSGASGVRDSVDIKVPPSNPPPGKPDIYLELKANGKALGRVVIKLFDDAAPRTCANFRALLKKPNQGYQSSKVGLAKNYDAVWFGCEDVNFSQRLPSIYDDKVTFQSDIVDISYDKPGYLLPWKGEGDATKPPKTSSSAFTVNLVPKLVWNKDYNGPFGIVISGLDVLESVYRDFQNAKTPNIVVSSCGDWRGI